MSSAEGITIDPEDAEQVKRLAEAYCAVNANVAIGPAVAADRIVKALREFANPTPPPCGRHLAFTRTRPNSRVSYTCTLDKGHDGSHHDAPHAVSWNADGPTTAELEDAIREALLACLAP